MTLQERLAAAREQLVRAGIQPTEAAIDVDVYARTILKWDRGRLLLNHREPVPDSLEPQFSSWIARREQFEPTAYIVGEREFWGLDFYVSPAVLVPRPETETLVEWALELAPAPRQVIDVGTGSGCIACAIAAARPAARVLAIDTSAAAAALARANATALGLADRVTVVVGDLLAAVDALRADLIIANLPYVPTSTLATLSPEVREHEPHAAVDGGPDGLREIRRLVAAAPVRLALGGVLVMETAGGTQTPEVVGLMGTAGFTGVATRRDLPGVERFVAGRCG